jgi:two-component system OmpR family response regulator
MNIKPPLKVVGSAEKTSSAAPRLRILIADDDRDTAVTLATLLRDEGHEVNVVLRGDEVLDVERLMRPDVLIIDINMPGMSGYAIAREIRERRPTASPLLVAISGVWTRTSERLVGHAVGFDHYLVKPCEPAELIALLNGFAHATSQPSSGSRPSKGR